MPVTATLSRAFYEKFGEQVTNELVTWFNAVDATYRADLRELNELNFARFDAKLEQRLAELDTRWERRLAELDVKWERRLAEFDIKLQQQKTELIKWMFTFWVPTAAVVVATGLGVLNLALRS